MTTFQMITVGAAILIGVSSFWPQIKAAISSATNVVKPKKPAIDDHPHTSDLSTIVGCWESLKNDCKRCGMDEAAQELDKIFPLFVPKKTISSVDLNINPSGDLR